MDISSFFPSNSPFDIINQIDVFCAKLSDHGPVPISSTVVSFLNNKNGRLSGVFKRNEAVSVILAALLFIMLIFARPNFLERVNLESVQTSVAPYGITCPSFDSFASPLVSQGSSGPLRHEGSLERHLGQRGPRNQCQMRGDHHLFLVVSLPA